MILKPQQLHHETLSTRGDLFLCLLSVQQFYTRPLDEKELIEIFEQGAKDPSIVDRQARLGNKAHLLTYHAKRLLGIDWYLYSADKKRPDVIIGSLGYTLVAFNTDYTYSTRTDKVDLRQVEYIAGLNWI